MTTMQFDPNAYAWDSPRRAAAADLYGRTLIGLAIELAGLMWPAADRITFKENGYIGEMALLMARAADGRILWSSDLVEGHPEVAATATADPVALDILIGLIQDAGRVLSVNADVFCTSEDQETTVLGTRDDDENDVYVYDLNFTAS